MCEVDCTSDGRSRWFPERPLSQFNQSQQNTEECQMAADSLCELGLLLWDRRSWQCCQKALQKAEGLASFERQQQKLNSLFAAAFAFGEWARMGASDLTHLGSSQLTIVELIRLGRPKPFKSNLRTPASLRGVVILAVMHCFLPLCPHEVTCDCLSA